MNFKFPKNDTQYHWTSHVMGKMVFYGLSPERIKRIIRNPERSEKGVAPDTIAVMQPNKILSSLRGKPSSWKEEIWTMYARRGQKKIIITAWRYPGKSPVREAVPIPAGILEELKNENLI